MVRDATDGIFKLFDTTTEDLSTASAVTFGANSINMADLYIGQLGLEDTNNSNILKLKWNEDDSSDRKLVDLPVSTVTDASRSGTIVHQRGSTDSPTDHQVFQPDTDALKPVISTM